MVKLIYSRMVQNLKLSGGYQYLQYIHALIMETYFGLMDNLMPQMIGKLSQMINLFKGDPDTLTLTEAIIVPYKAEFRQAMTQDIK